MENLVDQALALASKAHFGQVDKAGKPYILHPMRLASKFDSDEEKIVALLHDVLEDSDITFECLRETGFDEQILFALVALTRNFEETYATFIERVAANQLATAIKVADLQDNLDLTRLPQLTQSDLDRVVKYHAALNYLLSAPKRKSGE